MKNLDDNPQCFKVEVVEKSAEVVTREKWGCRESESRKKSTQEEKEEVEKQAEETHYSSGTCWNVACWS
jgi:hypothetical protein